MSFVNIPGIGSASWKEAVTTLSLLPTLGNAPGDARVVKDTSLIYIWNGTAWVLGAPTTTNSFIYIQPDVGTTPTATSPSDTLTLTSSDSTVTVTGNSTTDTVNFEARPADATHSGIVSTGTQTLAGNKTFSGTVGASNLSGTNTGDITAAGQNYLSLSGQTLTANPVSLANSNVTGILPIANGGWGQSMTMQTDSANGAHNALTPGLIKMTSSTGVVVNGITASATSTFSIIYNGSSANITITHQNSNASAANRIITPTGASVNVRPGEYALFFYDTVQSRNILIDFNDITSVTSPLSINSSGVLSITQAGAFQNGYLNSADWNTFNNKVSKDSLPSTGAIAFWNSGPTLSGRELQLSWNDAYYRMGVQVGTSSTSSALDIKSDVAQTIAAPGSITATLHLFSIPTEPSGVSAFQATADMPRPNSTSASINYSGSGFIANGTQVDYIIWSGNNSDGKWSVVGTPSFTAGTDDSSSNPYEIDISWNAPGGGFSPDLFYIQRQVNGGGFNEYIISPGGSGGNGYTDSNSGWNSGSSTPSPNYPDYTANGSSYSFAVYGTTVTPIPTNIYSISAGSGAFTDDNSGEPYQLEVSWSGGSSPYRLIVNDVSYIDTGGTAVAFGTDITPGNTHTPNTYGYQSDGNILNITYSAYSRQASPTLYSATSTDASTIDPNDSNYYYISVSVSGYGSDNPKVTKNGSVGIISNSFLDDGVTALSDGTTVTPVSIYDPGLRVQTHGTSNSEAASIIIKSLDGSYGRLEFQNNAGTRVGYLEQTGSSLNLHGQGGGQIYLNNSNSTLGLAATNIPMVATSAIFDVSSSGILSHSSATKLTWNSGGLIIADGVNIQTSGTTGTKIAPSPGQKISFWNATPIVQPTGNPISALTSAGLLASPTAITETQGGTNQTSYTQGDIIYASASNTLSKLAKSTSSTRYLSNTGSSNSPAWAQIDLTNGVTGTLPITNGGTGATTLVGAGITGVVTSVQLTNQSADIGSTNFSNTSTAGLYRVSYSLEDTTADLTAGAVSVSIAYTSGAGSTTITSIPQVLTGTGLTQSSIFIQLTSGSISYSTSHTGIFGSAKYAIYMTVERLV